MKKTVTKKGRKMRTLKPSLVLLVVLSLTACERAGDREARRERSTGAYQAAMTDLKAGRVAEAIAGFRKTCANDPANASARFQLACLLQDSGNDMLGAVCAFREFLVQQPKSDKAQVARDREALCERELARQLADKYALTDQKRLSAELEETKRQLQESAKRTAKLQSDMAISMQRVAHLVEENDRLKTALKDDSVSAASARADGIKSAKALLDEDDADRTKVSVEALQLKNEAEEGSSDRIAESADVARLRRESDEDEKLADTPLLAAHAPDAKPQPLFAERPKKEIPEPPHEKRPPYYVVQEGDSLYRIAMRFYGRSGAWKLIREANKAVISTDGRVNSGMKIKLPDPK